MNIKTRRFKKINGPFSFKEIQDSIIKEKIESNGEFNSKDNKNSFGIANDIIKDCLSEFEQVAEL